MGADQMIPLDGGELEPSVIDATFGLALRVVVSPGVLERVRAGREHIEALLKEDRPYYGINTGFGSFCDRRIPPDQLETLQENLILSHAVGVGPPAPDEIVRLMLLFKAHALSHGHSGVRPMIVEGLLNLLNADLLPLVPCKGSLGASGDLAPLAHMSLPLIGRGEVRLHGERLPADKALEKHGIEAVRLAAKEGLALINGTQFMTGYGAALCVRANRACKLADVLAAMSLEAVRGRLDPFDARLLAMRPHPGAIEVAENIRRLLAGRPANPSKPYGLRVQDPYSLRCAPQVHGASRDVIRHVEEVIYRDVNSVTDNPIITDDGAILSGGNFHGQPVALALDYLACGIAELASISERRQYLLVNDGHYRLPPGLIADSGLNSGFLIAQYTSASLVAENKVLCHPACVDSIPTAGGQEDHVSMGATSAVKGWTIMDNVETVLAIELLLSAQALEFTPADDLAPAIRTARQSIRRRIARADRDRMFGDDMQAALSLVRSREVLRETEAEIGALA
jgi:histidine ammonia-lyase